MKHIYLTTVEIFSEHYIFSKTVLLVQTFIYFISFVLQFNYYAVFNSIFAVSIKSSLFIIDIYSKYSMYVYYRWYYGAAVVWNLRIGFASSSILYCTGTFAFLFLRTTSIICSMYVYLYVSFHGWQPIYYIDVLSPFLL